MRDNTLTHKPCLLPFIHIETTPTGGARPCCQWQGADIGNFNTQTLDEIWHGEPLESLREQFRNNQQPQGCRNCWAAEASGYRSKRQNDNDRFSHYAHGTTLEAPVYLDLKLGSLCNIKCRICSTEYSHKWQEDETLIYGAPKHRTVLGWMDETSQFWQDLADIAHTIEFIDFTGGEPFLVKGHWRLLERLVELGVANNISVHYNTNGTVLPKQRHLWSKFKYVEVMYSFDGVAAKFNYQRHPADWHTCNQNFQTVLDEGVARVQLCHTVNIFNVLDMQEFAEWAPCEIYWNMLYGPAHYSIQNLPETVKLEVAHTIPREDIRAYMLALPQDANNWRMFWRTTGQLDGIRNETFESTFPELYALIKPYKLS